MKVISLLLLSSLMFSAAFSQNNKAFKSEKLKSYFPPAGSWMHRNSSEAGFDSIKLVEAITLAKTSESLTPRDQEISQIMSFGKEPFGEGTGPFSTRGEQTGIIIHKGYIIASWGEPERVDMTHSVTKSFLSTVVGLAVAEKFISTVSDTISRYVPGVEFYDPRGTVSDQPGKHELFKPFAGTHNSKITWDDMLRQASDWEGTLWGKPDWADRPANNPREWLNRKRNEPGAVFEYNDVRVNVLALAATNVWRMPLPRVLREKIMDPIGASGTWRWIGNRNAWIVLDGEPVQSVSGGGHWGGGMFINAYDMARFGLLTLHRGNWNGKQLISEEWIKNSLTPSKANIGYGYMNFFLNTDNKFIPSAPASAFAHVGNGANYIYVDPENDLVIVLRWIDTKSLNGIIEKVLVSLNRKSERK